MSALWEIETTQDVMELLHQVRLDRDEDGDPYPILVWKKRDIQLAEYAEKRELLLWRGGYDYMADDVGPMKILVRAFAFTLTEKGEAFVRGTTQ